MHYPAKFFVLPWLAAAFLPGCMSKTAPDHEPATAPSAAALVPPAVAPPVMVCPPDPARIKVHALAFSAIIVEMNHAAQNQLEVLADPEPQKQLLAKWWNVHNRDELLRLFDGMEDGTYGHRARLHELVSYYRLLRPEEILPKMMARAKSSHDRDVNLMAITYVRAPDGPTLRITAWDFGRYINLCRWGYGVGYLTEDEAWARILPAARLLQASFGSWAEFARDYLGGREFWSPALMRQNGSEARIAARQFDEPGGLWAGIPWKESLGGGPVLVDRYAESLKRPPAGTGQVSPPGPEAPAD